MSTLVNKNIKQHLYCRHYNCYIICSYFYQIVNCFRCCIFCASIRNTMSSDRGRFEWFTLPHIICIVPKRVSFHTACIYYDNIIIVTVDLKCPKRALYMHTQITSKSKYQHHYGIRIL